MKEILQDGAPVLRKAAPSVPEELFGSPELARLIGNMTNALDGEPEGVALAAPQIGISYRLFIVRKDRTLPNNVTAVDNDHPSGRTPEVDVYINPEIIKTSRKRARADEGCLSVRGTYGTTERHERVTIRARRPDGSQFERGGGNLMAQIFEHEIDHLDGILFTDHAEHLLHIAHETKQ